MYYGIQTGAGIDKLHLSCNQNHNEKNFASTVITVLARFFPGRGRTLHNAANNIRFSENQLLITLDRNQLPQYEKHWAKMSEYLAMLK